MSKEYILVSPKNADLEHPSKEVVVMFPGINAEITTKDEAEAYWANFVANKLPLPTQESLFRQGWEVREFESNN